MTRGYRTYLFAMLKGGVRKTTSAMFVAFELARRGEQVLVIDADRVTQGVTDWATRVLQSGADLPFDVVQAVPGQLLAVQLRSAVARLAAEGVTVTYVLLDVGGEQPETVREAALLADLVLMPVGTEQAEIGRVSNTIAVVGAATGDPSRYACLLTRVASPGRGLAAATRQLIDGGGHRVMGTEIPQQRELYALPWGTVPESTGAYAELVDELAATYDGLMLPAPAGQQ